MAKDEEEEELREEALAEWISRGRAAQDFTMEKMIKLWDEEDEGEEEDGEELADKQELMKGYQMLGPFLDQAKDTARQFKETAIVEGKKALVTAWKYAELPPLRDRRLLRQHVVHVHEMDAETKKYSQIRQRVVEEMNDAKKMEEELQFGLKKRNKRQAPLLNRFQELKAEADRVQQAQILEEIEQRRRERIDKSMQEKQRQLEEKEEKAKKLLAQRRQRNMKFWQKQLVEAREFAEQQIYDQKRKEEFDRKVEEAKEEMHMVEEEENVDAMRAFKRLQTTSSIGIFDTAYEPGEWNSAIDGGFQSGLDEHTIGISNTRGYIVENEQKRLELMEIQSKVTMLREKLDQVEQAKTNLGLDMRTVLERKDHMLQEIKQVRAEQDELNEILAGPPRRDPSEREKQQFHTMVTRRAAYVKQLGDLDARIANIQQRTAIVHRSEASFLPMLRETEDKLTELQSQVNAIEKERHELPVVVGKAIFQPDGVPIRPEDASEVSIQIAKPVIDPTKLLHQIKMESKFEILKSAVTPVNEHYKKAKTQAIEAWKMNEYRSLAEQDLDNAKARLVKVRDRFVELQNSSLRSDIVHAIQKYHQDGNKLRQCIFPLKGQIEWWSHQMPKKSMGLTYSVEKNVIILAEGETTGRITGCFHLPKRCSYRIQMNISIERTKTDSGEASDATEELERLSEDWKLYVGPEMDSLQHHIFRDLGGKVLRSGELFFEFSGIRLCFSLDITHRSTIDPKRKTLHYVLSNVARYEERLEDFREEENRMRLHQKEKHFVSELVKTIRMQSKKTSSQRATELLQELIQVERSKAKMWDSTMFHGHSQRFKRVEYVNMLRGEIKKEIAVQIDYSIALRQGRVSESEMLAVGTPIGIDTSLKGKRKEESRMDFQARKSALMEPKRLSSQRFLGDYCSFKSQIATSTTSESYRKETMIMGVRYEWREARTKLHVMHKLCGPSSYTNMMESIPQVKTEWFQLDNANAVFLASSCTRMLKRKRKEEAEARVLLVTKEAKIEKLQLETQKNIQEENEAASREAQEDEILSQQMQHELARREKLFYADAIRLTTYNENISSQIDFQVQRKMNRLAQQPGTISIEPIVHEVKENFARQFVQGKLALVKKTWERKIKRVANKRTKARMERNFRIRHEQELMNEVNESNERELATLKADQEKRAKEELLRIPNFQAAVEQTFDCEHLEVKAWGTKYDIGLKCKKCGKEVSNSCDDPDHARGGNRELDEDVRRHRAQTTSGIGFRFKSSEHLQKIENERLRLEKEARSMEELESMLYDRLDPKPIDDFNYRHGINRGTLLDNADSSDPLYPRLIQDIHRAAHQDEILFHGRLRNFNFRIQQIFRQHAECTRRLALQRVFLENVQHENDIVLKKLPLIEADHARAVALIEEDQAAMKHLEEAKVRMTAAQNEREAAYYASEGVEEEAEFSEFHAPALIKSSDEMNIIYQRIQSEFNFVTDQLKTAKQRVEKAEAERNKIDQLMNQLYCQTQNAILRTRFGFVSVEYYRTEDNCVVVTPLHWEATLFIPMNEILSYEAMYREEEIFSMADEDECGHEFVRLEREMEISERHAMEIEDKQIQEIMTWRAKKEKEEELLMNVICQEELESQLAYEMEGRKANLTSARQEAAIIQRRGRVYPSRVRKPISQRPSRLDAKRVARASEKRLAMAMIEQKLLNKERHLRDVSMRERNTINMGCLAREVFDELLGDTIKELCEERVQQGKHEAHELLRGKCNAVMVATDQSTAPAGAFVAPLIGLDRLWISRKQKYTMLYSTWSREFAKLQLVRDEMARREELRRLAEEERIRLETRRKEMLAEERQSRKFYLEEMVLSMHERKAMASAEIEMKEYLRQLELEAMKTKYSKMIDDRNRVNDKAARRLEIKLGKNEQHRLHREWRQIKIEDELSMQIREKEIADALAEALEHQFDKYLADQMAQGKISAEMEASRLAERLREAQQVAAEKHRAFKMKMVQERMITTVQTFYAISRVEVEWMDAIERFKFWEFRAPLLENNLKRMEPELKRIQEERKHVVNDAQSKRDYAEKCKKRIEEADASLSNAIQEEEKAMIKYKRVHKLNATIDSEVLHDRVQRFRTAYLRDRLHSQYFALLTDSIVRRALVECSEREIVRLEAKIKQLEQERVVKSKEVSVLQRKRRRALRMRLRRAELGKLMFGRSQQRLLKEMFQRWTKLWSERTRVRASFKLKHELLLQKQKLTMTTSSPILKKESLVHEIKVVSIPTRISVMHDHQRRLLQCRLCRQKYSEEQNNRYSCVYHPGTYEFACVRTCETRRNASTGPAAVPASCMMHRAKRWLCCDETDEGRYGSSGCARRFHLPTRNNPELEDLVERKTGQEQTVLDQINQQLLELRERNVVGKMKFATKSVVTKMEQDLAKQRATAAKFHTLDRRS
ncbi:Hypothetical protein PHPALM_8491 [Phytophthora palmivora]|uniref:Uncharacterized protein n=1 Tax=Phytophthora palmivora TaxID=4796 RepID=A0A2P4Y9S4_9STRA|nr:Hypothetical protein PHPALM_8491 [Phytophthora palmivora]